MVVTITTTYRHDYKPPETNRYRFLQVKNIQDAKDCDEKCKCFEKYKVPDTAKAALKKSHLKSEWTGIAPMGKLIDPRIIPEPKYDDSEKASACQRDQPNRFLKILQTCYPDLYERLKSMPQNELQRRLDKERLVTTYQVDYCGIPEYPEGLYASMDEKKEEKKPGLATLTDGCEDYREEVFGAMKSMQEDDECLQTYKPSKAIGVQADFGQNKDSRRQDETGHWTVKQDYCKNPGKTEYMDSISRTGCIIVSNKLHDHSKCRSGRNCVHKLTELCQRM